MAVKVKVGDQFKVTRDNLNFADVKAGQIITVGDVNGSSFYTDDQYEWVFDNSHIGNGLEPLTSADEFLNGIDAQIKALKSLRKAYKAVKELTNG